MLKFELIVVEMPLAVASPIISKMNLLRSGSPQL
jgi:hypothetical protein